MPQRDTCYIFIVALLIAQVGVAYSSSSNYNRGKRSKFFLAASHSNFLRSNFQGQHHFDEVLCHKNASVCSDISRNPGGGVCCFNRVCKQTQSDDSNCGGCNKACSYGLSCCAGKCVNLMTDSRHCGRCNTCCHHNVACEFGLCGYGDGGYVDNSNKQQQEEHDPVVHDHQARSRYPKQWR